MARILVYSSMEIDVARRDAVLRESAADIAASLREPGCLAYEWGADLLNPARIIVFEEWESEADLAMHFREQPYLSMGARLKAANIGAFIARKFRVDVHGDIYDANGTARAGFE